jgi:hypothetical protein
MPSSFQVDSEPLCLCAAPDPPIGGNAGLFWVMTQLHFATIGRGYRTDCKAVFPRLVGQGSDVWPRLDYAR